MHLRQLRSKFHQRSTFSLARSFSIFTADITVQPSTIYTLVNSITKSEKGRILGSRIMELIANSILEGDGMLKQHEIKELLPKVIEKETQVISDALKIIDLFEDDCEVKVVENTSLAANLRSVAVSTTNGLRNGNRDIIKNIWNMFLKG